MEKGSPHLNVYQEALKKPWADYCVSIGMRPDAALKEAIERQLKRSDALPDAKIYSETKPTLGMATAVQGVQTTIMGVDENMSYLRGVHCVDIQHSAALFRTHAVMAVAIFKYILKSTTNSESLNMAAWTSIRLGPLLSISIDAHAPTVENKV